MTADGRPADAAGRRAHRGGASSTRSRHVPRRRRRVRRPAPRSPRRRPTTATSCSPRSRDSGRARARRSARRSTRAEGGAAGARRASPTSRRPRRSSLLSDGAQTQGEVTPGGARAAPDARHSRLHDRPRNARRGRRAPARRAASPSGSACRRTRGRSAPGRGRRAGRVLHGADDEEPAARLRGARLAARPREKEARGHRRVRGRGDGAAPRRRRALDAPLQEAAMRLALVLAAAALAAARRAAGAGDERVRRPRRLHQRAWAVGGRPGRATGRLATVEYQLACPRGGIVGGLDAVLAATARCSVRFLGKLGSPVNPGITTERGRLRRHVRAAGADVLPAAARLHPDLGRRRRTTTGVDARARPPPVAARPRTLRVRGRAALTLVVRCRARRAPGRLVATRSLPDARAPRPPCSAVVVSARARDGASRSAPPRRRSPVGARRRAGARDLREGAGMRFEWPLALLALLVVPLAAGGLPARAAAAVAVRARVPEPRRAGDASSTARALAALVPPALFLLALAALASRSPARRSTSRSQREQATIVLAIDSSGSMLAEDVAPTRLEAAKAAVRRSSTGCRRSSGSAWSRSRPEPQVVAPLSTDRELVRSVARLPGPAARDGDRRRGRARRRGGRGRGRAAGRAARAACGRRPGAAAGESAGGRPAPLGRLPDGRDVSGRSTAPRAQGARHPRLLDRARHRRGRGRLRLRRRGAGSRCRPTASRCA